MIKQYRESYHRLDTMKEYLTLDSVAGSVARLYRFGGAGQSVALHSIDVMRRLESLGASHTDCFWGLAHDIQECILGDTNAVIKRVAGEAFKAEEEAVQTALLQHLGFWPVAAPSNLVKDADNYCYHKEVDELRAELENRAKLGQRYTVLFDWEGEASEWARNIQLYYGLAKREYDQEPKW